MGVAHGQGQRFIEENYFTVVVGEVRLEVDSLEQAEGERGEIRGIEAPDAGLRLAFDGARRKGYGNPLVGGPQRAPLSGSISAVSVMSAAAVKAAAGVLGEVIAFELATDGALADLAADGCGDEPAMLGRASASVNEASYEDVDPSPGGPEEDMIAPLSGWAAAHATSSLPEGKLVHKRMRQIRALNILRMVTPPVAGSAGLCYSMSLGVTSFGPRANAAWGHDLLR